MPTVERTLGMTDADARIHLAVRGLLFHRAACGAGRIVAVLPQRQMLDYGSLACRECQAWLTSGSPPPD
jgi:hypothetical protein